MEAEWGPGARCFFVLCAVLCHLVTGSNGEEGLLIETEVGRSLREPEYKTHPRAHAHAHAEHSDNPTAILQLRKHLRKNRRKEKGAELRDLYGRVCRWVWVGG